MIKYPKIKTVYLRDAATKYKTLLWGQYALPEFEYLAGNEWEWSEKIDGTNIRIWWGYGDLVSFHGRTDRAQIPPFLLTELRELFPAKKLFELCPTTTMTLYGEGCGRKIQRGGGNYIPDGVSFILFDVLVEGIWLERHNVEDIADKLGIDVVPIIGRGPLRAAIKAAQDGFQSRIGTQIAEGLVMRPTVELLDRRGNRIVAKIKHKDFVS